MIKMIIKGLQPTQMSHVSGKHRVDVDWLFERINLKSKIQVKFVNTNVTRC